MATIWDGWYWHLGLASLLAMGGAISAKSDCALAQITPDSTLGAESSVVTPNVDINGLPSDRIDGGAIRGANLFHSFQEFNIGEGRGAYFTNPAAIANILSRVTGNDVSDIFGKLGVLGNANLFLINPQGIIFGPNASLDIGGSFVGTTANAIGFGNQGFFSASTPDVAPLLTVNPDAFFFNQIAPGPIINRAASTTTAAENLTGVLRDPGLQVPQGQSLLLVGGDVRLEGGHIQAQGGRVELGGLASPGSVGLSMNGGQSHLSFPDGVTRADVYLVPRADGYLTEEDSNTAWVNVASSNGGSGSIAITARNINITQGALRGGIEQDSRFPGAQAGGFSLNATGAINVITSLINNRVRPRAVGNGGNINITTGSLSMTNGARLNTATSSQGNAGSVNIDARDTVSFNGVGSNLAEPESGAFSDVASEEAVGNGGDINITTGSLSVTNGAILSANTNGRGNAGNVNINARESVFFDGVGGSNGYSSAVYSTVESGAVGKGGDINITTGSLSVTNGAILSANTNGPGNAGSININARESVSFDGVGGSNRYPSAAYSSVENEGVGNGGDINITTGSLSVTNAAYLDAGTARQGDAGSVIINARDTVSFDGGYTYSTVDEGAVGNGGDINITTGSLSLMNGGGLIASSEGSGAAGNIEVAANSIRLNSKASLSSNTIAGEGNISLRSGDLVLRGESFITTNAFGTATGGNITIDSDVLAALENSDISANSQNAFGGRVRINTQGIFGAEFRLNPTPESDITATGGSPELSGTVEINTPDVDTSLGLVNLPIVPIDTEVVQACQPGGSEAESEFVITGRGGLPPSPQEPLSSDAIQVDWVTLNPETENRSRTAPSTNPTSVSAPTTIVEANGWVINNKGEVVLTANAPTATQHIPWVPESDCHAPEPES